MKLDWTGVIKGIQPRIRLIRSFNEKSHAYLGYVLTMVGDIEGSPKEFTAAIGKATQSKHLFRAGDEVSGSSEPVIDPQKEISMYYKTSGLVVLERGPEDFPDPPPWLGIPPIIEVYRERGHRHLSARTYRTKCRFCLWGCRMPVEMIVDHWNPSVVRYRTETFCYGPKSCKYYSPGPPRRVPGRKGLIWVEEDWVEEEETAHRSLDE